MSLGGLCIFNVLSPPNQLTTDNMVLVVHISDLMMLLLLLNVSVKGDLKQFGGIRIVKWLKESTCAPRIKQINKPTVSAALYTTMHVGHTIFLLMF